MTINAANLAIDFGGTVIKLALMRDGEPLARTVTNNHSRADDLDSVAEIALQLCSQAGLSPADLGGVGLSFPGIIDTNARKILSINGKYAHLVGVDLGEWARRVFSLPAIVDNDARLALAGEIGYGVAKGKRDAVAMILGTGIGTAAMIDGRLLRGAHFQAGILGGHFTIETNGHACTCGNRGCAEAEAGSWNIPTIVRSHPDFEASSLNTAAVLDFKAVSDAHRAGDAIATQILARLTTCWAICVVNLIHAYDPEIVVLSGGLMRSHDLILPPIRKRIAEFAWTPLGAPDIRMPADSTSSALMGLDYLINHTESQTCLP